MVSHIWKIQIYLLGTLRHNEISGNPQHLNVMYYVALYSFFPYQEKHYIYADNTLEP